MGEREGGFTLLHCYRFVVSDGLSPVDLQEEKKFSLV